MIARILDLVRIKDWFKNIIVFLPLIFSGNIQSYIFYPKLILSFLIFCFTATCIYIINDIVDVKEDKFHSIKQKTKPLANKTLSIHQAVILLIFFSLLVSILLFVIESIIYHILLYVILSLAYTFFLKKIPIIDLIIISFGYLIRLDIGSSILQVNTSLMLLVSVFSLSFFVISIKRYVEFNNQSNKRTSLIYYSSGILKFLIYSAASIFLTCSFIFFTNQNNNLLIIFPFLSFVLFRYYKISLKFQQGEFPIDLVLKDRILLICCSLIFLFIIFLYY